MPTNANTFNSRVTSEALEKKFRDVFPAQGGAELVQDLFASGVIQPVIDFSSVAEGSVLPQNLQTAWDFSTGSILINAATLTTIINNTGFWLVDVNYSGYAAAVAAVGDSAYIDIFDGSSSKKVWGMSASSGAETYNTVVENKFVVFLRSGDSLRGKCQDSNQSLDVWYRQIADVSGNLVNPLGFTFS